MQLSSFFKWKTSDIFSSTGCTDKLPVIVFGLDGGGNTVSKLVNNEGSEPPRPAINPKISKTVSDRLSQPNFDKKPFIW